MQVLVSDSSVLIEIAKREVLDRMFTLDFQFTVPDILFEEELIDLGRYSRQDLLDFGLSVGSLEPEGVATAVAYQDRRRALSMVDCFALALARRHGYTLLSEDRRMRACAAEEGILHHGVLWVVDQMLGAALLSAAETLAALEAMKADPRCPVSRQELALRLQQLNR
ncbi:MAG: PIN domain-containing protein [Synechococcus sp. SB0668_bin_15]|nr:PIN domain-containing protein [Synechococcus sp. SB0668_bin_15]MXZ83762.1 PIN domain-containing protein [Synechococcus sp. SB0666_bin_14]MYA91102.1 PIN domain-containing protein [Synechococcus sp. SB0663_bin_10]MYC50099.1 PIN domain-containing protein [Synechococcus sp. SB0662_bin_14]MYG47683.1 PIN domain-containing protein [Synechococcus sp. SB0675_bin_6]MYJ59811.1 PIN domain-containing protein [Synechococcus sp. SB0672_bin_6]MYK91429.1 PIN domain-containing protein [Synechococcus sp. SB0